MGSSMLAESWLAENYEGMIHCPYQPGQLMISKSACIKRYATAQEDKAADPMKGGNVFFYNLKRGLSVCRDCPIGRRLVDI
jgi:hypothetical protein